MAEIRTSLATVIRLAGGKGVVVEEITLSGDREYKSYFTAWLGEGHGLIVGDQARFQGQISTKKTEKDEKIYFDVNMNQATVVEGTLIKKPETRSSWEPGQDTGGWGS